MTDPRKQGSIVASYSDRSPFLNRSKTAILEQGNQPGTSYRDGSLPGLYICKAVQLVCLGIEVAQVCNRSNTLGSMVDGL